MKKCVILSMDDTTGFEVYDQLLEQPLKEAGWDCHTISWRAKNIDWNDYLLVMIRSPWDYQDHVEEFLGVLETINQSSAFLDNPLEIIHWNINKKYLAELESKGVEIVPTLWRENIQLAEIDLTEKDNFFKLLDCTEIVIKPCVSACAFDTYRLTLNNVDQFKDELIKTFKNRDFMVQPFMHNIIEEGEHSVFYFDGEYSHAILKTPKDNDFRVQEEYGGRLLKIEPEAELKLAAEKVLQAIDTSLLYGRLDFVRTDTGFAIMEAELIEPSLYFNLDAQAAQRFVDAVERRMKRKGIIL